MGPIPPMGKAKTRTSVYKGLQKCVVCISRVFSLLCIFNFKFHDEPVDVTFRDDGDKLFTTRRKEAAFHRPLAMSGYNVLWETITQHLSHIRGHEPNSFILADQDTDVDVTDLMFCRRILNAHLALLLVLFFLVYLEP